ncbi:MAG: hypothetical protein J2P32_11910, partial [Actinobacteria bacterium]|nr:hypothetical protein [Actinomycetota bacterium]
AAVAAVSRLGLGGSPAIGLSGGVLRASGRFRALVTDGITERGLSPRIAVLSSTDEALAFADRAAEGAAGLLADTGGLALTVA